MPAISIFVPRNSDKSDETARYLAQYLAVEFGGLVTIKSDDIRRTSKSLKLEHCQHYQVTAFIPDALHTIEEITRSLADIINALRADLNILCDILVTIAPRLQVLMM